MGTLDFKHQKEHLKRICDALLRRGLVPDLKEEWGVHGPHQGWNYQVYVGYALPKDEKEKCRVSGCDLPWKKCKRHANFDCVAIYPKSVYKIEKPCDWANASSDDRIPVL